MVIDVVGSEVGCDEGWLVGVEGRTEGADDSKSIDGLRVGFLEVGNDELGTIVGVMLGIIVGDGDWVGFSCIGCLLGLLEGCDEGFDEGCVDGCLRVYE